MKRILFSWGQALRCPFSIRLPWFVTLLCVLGLMTTLIGTVAAASYWVFYFFPAQTYHSLETGFWSGLNVEHTPFSSRAAFSDIEKKLRNITHETALNTDPFPYFLLGRYHQAAGLGKQALNDYHEAETRIQKSAWHRLKFAVLLDNLYAEKALIYYQNQQPQAALNSLSRIRDMNALDDPKQVETLRDVLESPDRADYHYQFGLTLRRIALLPEARQELQRALTLAGDPVLTENIRQALMLKLPKTVSALSPWGRYEFLSGVALIESGNNADQAIRCLQNAIRESGGFEWDFQKMAEAHYQLKQYGIAEQWADKALALNPAYYPSYLTMADIEMDKTHYAAALDFYKKAMTLCEAAMHGAYTGGTHDGMPAGDASDNTLSEEAEHDNVLTTLAGIHNQMGYALEAMGQRRNALAHYQSAYDLADADSDDFQYAENGMTRLQQSGIQNHHPSH